MSNVLLLTRTKEKNEDDKRTRFSMFEGQIVTCPLIDIQYHFEWTANDIDRLKQVQWLFFSSQYGVRACFETLKQQGLLSEVMPIIREKKIAVIGTYTKQVAESYGCDIIFCPRQAHVRAFIAEWEAIYGDASGIWVNGDQLTHTFATHHHFFDWTMYSNCCPQHAEEQLYHLLEHYDITEYFVSSPSIWERFYTIATKADMDLRHIQYDVLGKTTANAIKKVLPKAHIQYLHT